MWKQSISKKMTSFYSWLGWKSHVDDDDHKRKQFLKKLSSYTQKTIFSILLILAIYWIFFFIMSKTAQRIKATKIDVTRDAVLSYPYRDLDEFIFSSRKCKPVEDLSSLIFQDWVDVKKDEKEWIIVSMVGIFEHLQLIVEKERNNSLLFFCSTMLGIDGLPCACVLYNEKEKEYSWMLEIEPLESLEATGPMRPSMVVNEVSFLFSKEHRYTIKKVIPQKVSVYRTVCKKKTFYGTLICQRTRTDLQAESVFIYSRLLYFLNADPKRSREKTGYFGTFESVR